MHLSTTFIALVPALFGIALGCSPDLQGLRFSVSNGFAIEWAPGALTAGSAVVAQDEDFATGEFYAEQQSDFEYVFRAVGSSLAISATQDALHLNNLDVKDDAQRFTIDCNACNIDGTAHSGGCMVKSVAVGRCIHYQGDAGGDIIVRGCNPRAGAQRWAFDAEEDA